MDLSQNPNQSPLFCKWVGELPRPVQASLSPFVVQLFPSASGTFHPPVCLSPTAGERQSLIHSCLTETNTLHINILHITYTIILKITHSLQGICQLPPPIATLCCCQFIPLPSYSAPFDFFLR